jgi:hypothetical protein
MGVAGETNVERRIPIGSLVWVILIVSSMSIGLSGSREKGRKSFDLILHPNLEAQCTSSSFAALHQSLLSNVLALQLGRILQGVGARKLTRGLL